MTLLWFIIGIIIGALLGFIFSAFLCAGRVGDEKSNEYLITRYSSIFSAIKTIIEKNTCKEITDTQTVEQIKNLLRN